MNCTICSKSILAEVQETEKTGGSLPEGEAHATCFWKRVAAVRLDRMESLQCQLDDLRDYVAAKERPLWQRLWHGFVDRVTK